MRLVVDSDNATPFFILLAMHLVNIAYLAYFAFFVATKFLPVIWIYFILDQAIPHTAACTLSEDGIDAFFAIGYQANVVVYKMNCATGQTITTELKESNIVPRIFNNLTGAFRWETDRYSSQGFDKTSTFYTILILPNFFAGVKIQTAFMLHH